VGSARSGHDRKCISPMPRQSVGRKRINACRTSTDNTKPSEGGNRQQGKQPMAALPDKHQVSGIEGHEEASYYLDARPWDPWPLLASRIQLSPGDGRACEEEAISMT
jgi:hypothetical protein